MAFRFTWLSTLRKHLRFPAATVAPTIDQEAVGDVLGQVFSLLAQNNNSATLKAGDLQLAGGINEGAGPDGDTILGTGIAQLEVDNDLPGIGVFENAPVGQQTVTGARNTEAAQASHYTAMEAFGWIVDSTTIQTAFEVVTGSATPTFDFATTRMLVLDLDDAATDVTSSTLVAPPSIDAKLIIKIIQDSTPRTIVWPAEFTWTHGSAPPLPAGDNDELIIHGVWDGTTLHVTALDAEAGATADQTGAEIKTAYEAEGSAFTDAQFDKLAILSINKQLNIPLNEFLDADTTPGTPLTLFADGETALPGFWRATEASGIRWNDHATPGDIQASIPMPQDLDETADIELHFLVAKTGATLADAFRMESSVVWQTDGAEYDGDSPVTDVSGPVVGNDAAKTVTELITTIANGDIPASPSSMNIRIHPTDGTLDTDDCILFAMWIEYTAKAS